MPNDDPSFRPDEGRAMSAVERLVESGTGGGGRLLDMLAIDQAIGPGAEGAVSRGEVAMALAACLFAGLLETVRTAADYTADRARAGERIHFDHGAIRTVLLPGGATGALPPGEQAFRRILEPLGYRVAGTYPLPRLRMTGRAYCHLDHPQTIPQYFVSELHVAELDPAAQAVAARVFGGSRDPLGPAAWALLDEMAAGGAARFEVAAAGLPDLVAAFGRQHELPSRADYDALRAESAEAAWIATEGNSFNHATDRVADVAALAEAQRALERPIKDAIEVSANRRVRQTAFRADPVVRRLSGEDVSVPGSFYEFIQRDVDPATGQPDLGFDSGNATGIFQMTKAGPAA